MEQYHTDARTPTVEDLRGMVGTDSKATYQLKVTARKRFQKLGHRNYVQMAEVFVEIYFASFRTDHPEGWFFKTFDWWQDKHGLGRRVVEHARRDLSELGMVEERHWRSNRVEYRLIPARTIEVLYPGGSSLDHDRQTNAAGGEQKLPSGQELPAHAGPSLDHDRQTSLDHDRQTLRREKEEKTPSSKPPPPEGRDGLEENPGGGILSFRTQPQTPTTPTQSPEPQDPDLEVRPEVRKAYEKLEASVGDEYLKGVTLWAFAGMANMCPDTDPTDVSNEYRAWCDGDDPPRRPTRDLLTVWLRVADGEVPSPLADHDERGEDGNDGPRPGRVEPGDPQDRNDGYGSHVEDGSAPSTRFSPVEGKTRWEVVQRDGAYPAVLMDGIPHIGRVPSYAPEWVKDRFNELEEPCHDREESTYPGQVGARIS